MEGFQSFMHSLTMMAICISNTKHVYVYNECVLIYSRYSYRFVYSYELRIFEYILSSITARYVYTHRRELGFITDMEFFFLQSLMQWLLYWLMFCKTFVSGAPVISLLIDTDTIETIYDLFKSE